KRIIERVNWIRLSGRSITAVIPNRLLKYWSRSRVEAEGMDGEERVRRIPAWGCNERATRPAALSASRPEGCVDFGAGRRCSLDRDRCGYRRCARVLANAKIDSNAAHFSISTVS